MVMITAVHLGAVTKSALALLGLASALGCGHAEEAPREPRAAERTTSRQTLREVASAYVCWMREDASDAFYPVLGYPECAHAQEQRAPLAAIVRGAVMDVLPILRFSMDARADSLARVCPAPAATGVIAPANACLREGFWADPDLGGVVEAGMSRGVLASGWRCDDCVEAPRRRERTISSQEIRPFVSAYVWPAEAEGGTFEIYVCAAVNGAHATSGDADYVRLGFLIAQAFVESEIMRDAISHVAERGRSGEIGIDAARAELARLVAAEPARTLACGVAERFAWHTGVRLTDCARASTPATAEQSP